MLEAGCEERETSAQDLQKLAEWVAACKPSDLPERVINRARWVLLDDLGAILGGNGEEQVTRVRNRFLLYKQPGKATIFGPGLPSVDPFTAAEVNGIASCWLELDEGCTLGVHAGIYVLPALLAMAEVREATIGEVLTALVVGYEVGARISEAWELRPMLKHKHGVFPAMTAAAACCHLSQANAEATWKAMATAAALTVASPYDQSLQGSYVRNLWPGVGASLGIKSLLFAEAGICGLPTTMYSTFHDVYGAAFQPGKLHEHLGTRFAIDYGWHKAYACCHDIHSALEALMDIRERHAKEGNVPVPAKIVVKTNEKVRSMKETHPQTALGAKFSLPHAAAATWKFGAPGKRAFQNDTLTDEEMMQLRERVYMEPLEAEPSSSKDQAHVTVYFENGETDEASAHFALGDREKPFTEELLYAKFVEMTSGIVPGAPGMARSILHLSSEATAADLVGLLKGDLSS